MSDKEKDSSTDDGDQNIPLAKGSKAGASLDRKQKQYIQKRNYATTVKRTREELDKKIIKLENGL
jgi:hypothetical protein